MNRCSDLDKIFVRTLLRYDTARLTWNSFSKARCLLGLYILISVMSHLIKKMRKKRHRVKKVTGS